MVFPSLVLPSYYCTFKFCFVCSVLSWKIQYCSSWFPLSSLSLYHCPDLQKSALFFKLKSLYLPSYLLQLPCSSDTSLACIWHLAASLGNFLLRVFYFFICSTIIQVGFTLRFAGFHQSGWCAGSYVSTEIFYLKAIRLKCAKKGRGWKRRMVKAIE